MDGGAVATDGPKEREGAVMRVEVDRDRCEGNAVCVGIAPDIFDLDDDDYAVVKADPVPEGQEDLAEQSIAECPRAALNRRD
jgi:ferredoxin